MDEAFRILNGRPYLLKHFVPWARHVSPAFNRRDKASLTTLEMTIQFIRLHKFPKAKTLNYLADNDIKSDLDVLTKIILPIAQRVTEYQLGRAIKKAA